MNASDLVSDFMRPANPQGKSGGPLKKIEFELEARIVDSLQVMETFTKIPKSEIVTIAVKRFIATHKDYFPEGYQSNG